MPLPNGLALNPATGQISGTPTLEGAYSFTLRVRDSQGNQRDIPVSINIAAYTAPSLTGDLDDYANRNVAYSSGLTVNNGTAPFVWSIASGTPPTGMTINASTGVISGTPTDTTYTDRTITVRVVDAVGSAAQKTEVIRYADTLALGGALATGIQGTAYSDGFDRSGGHAPFVFSIVSGSLPAGLSFDPSTGIISGTPTGTSSTTLTIRVTDAAGATADASGTLTVNSSYVPVDIAGSISNNSQNVETLSEFSITPNYTALTVTGGSGTITYSWARISGSTAISPGSPTTRNTSFVGNVSPGASISAVFRLTATDGTSSDTFDVTITVNNTYVALGLTATLDKATRTVAYSDTLTRTGGKSPYTFSVVGGTLPTGITLSSTTGALTGTPTDTSYTNRSMTFRVTDALGATKDVTVTLEYANFPTLSYAAAYAMRTRAFTLTPTAAGGHAPLSYAVQSGVPVTGLSVAGGTGVVSGTPTSTTYGTNSFTVRGTDAAANAVDAGVTIDYVDNLAIAGTYASGLYTGTAYSSSALSASGGFAGARVWSVASGSLPPGLSLNSSTGALTGTPTTADTYGFTIRVTDPQGFTADSAQSLTVAVGLSVTVTPSSRIATFTNDPASNTPTTRAVTTASFVASASGGSGTGYTYAWTRLSGTANATINSPSSATTTFTDPDAPIDSSTSDSFQVTATDSVGNTATFDVSASFIYNSGF